MSRVAVIWIARDASDWTRLRDGLMELLGPRTNRLMLYEGTCVWLTEAIVLDVRCGYAETRREKT